LASGKFGAFLLASGTGNQSLSGGLSRWISARFQNIGGKGVSREKSDSSSDFVVKEQEVVLRQTLVCHEFILTGESRGLLVPKPCLHSEPASMSLIGMLRQLSAGSMLTQRNPLLGYREGRRFAVAAAGAAKVSGEVGRSVHDNLGRAGRWHLDRGDGGL
jgi:hypothetical protein